MTHHALFETAIGTCAIAWRDDKVVHASLPAVSRAALEARMPRDSTAAAPPPVIQAAIEAIGALLSGEKRNLSGIALDMGNVPELDARVYADALTIPPGETTTYGAIATRLGNPMLAREVGQALGRNPFPPIVPCHRVLAAGGKSGGFSAPGGVATKRRMLAIEAVHALGSDDLFGPAPTAN